MDIMNSIIKRGSIKSIRKKIDIVKLLHALGVVKKGEGKARGEEFWAVCPNPEHKTTSIKWSINIDPEHERFGTHRCFSCSYRGNFITLTAERLTKSTGKNVDTKQAVEFIKDLFTLGNIDEDALMNLMLEEKEQLREKAEKEVGPSQSSLPEEFRLIPNNAKNVYFKYLTKPISEGGRELEWDIIDKYGMGYCAEGLYRKRIIIPFWQKGVMISFLARSILPTINSVKKDGDEFVICPECEKNNKYGQEICIKCDHELRNYVTKKSRARYPKGSTMEFMLWPFDDLDPELDYVVLVEGAMDKLRLELLGYRNVLCCFGNKVSDFQVELLKEHEKKIGKKLKVYVFPDADDGGVYFIEVANEKLKYPFETYVIQLPWVPEKWLDPGAATEEEVAAAFENAEKIHRVYKRVQEGIWLE